MSLRLYPRVAEGSRIRVWAGAFGRTGAPNLSWTVDGIAAQPKELRPLGSVRGPELLEDPDTPRAFSGLYEFEGFAPGSAHHVSVRSGREFATAAIRTLPARVPHRDEGWLHVLLVSCFHHAEATPGQLEAALLRARRRATAECPILMGDQVYLDLPTLKNFPKDARKLAGKFERDYVRNWRDNGYARVLAAAPSVAIPDDHEYWNNFPHKSPLIGNSCSKEGRDNWYAAARACFEGFQEPAEGGVVEITIHPLSFLVVDGRSERDYHRAFALTDETRDRIEDWVESLERHGRNGVFVTGQSLFAEPVARLQGRIADYELPNYGDYAKVMRLLTRTRRDLTLVTGDVHWGRVARAYDVRRMRRIVEVITSPSALVTTVGVDTFKRVGGFFSGLFGRRDPWPRHCDPEDPPEFLAQAALGSGYPTGGYEPHRQVGDQFAILSFRRVAGRLDARVTYWPVHSRVRDPVDVRLPPIRLS